MPCCPWKAPATAAPVSPEGAAELGKGYAAFTQGELRDGVVRSAAGEPRDEPDYMAALLRLKKTLTPEQADYIGVDIDGPFKGEFYRY